jgi:hypothetical protein
MEVTIQNLKAIALNFPKRKLRNRDEKNWNTSEKQRIILEKQSTCLDGEKGGVIVKSKTAPFLKEMIASGKVDINIAYIPEETDSEIERLLDIDTRNRLGGRDISEVDDVMDLIQAGLIKL